MNIYAVAVPEWIRHNAEMNIILKRLMKLCKGSYFK
jgi:hypothetical protein